MKRIVAFLLTLALCLGLVACDDVPTRTKSKYAELEEMLDEGRYGEALTYILSLQAQNSSSVPLFGVVQPGDNTVTDEELNAGKEPSAEVLALIDSMMGEWIITSEEQELPQKFVFCEDGTCTVDGTEMTWKREATALTDNTLDALLSVWEGDVERYQIKQPTKSDAGEMSFLVGVVNEGVNVTHYYFDRYICLAHYEAVELTMDNWQEYFEFTAESFHKTDAFGDLSSMGMSYRMALKDEYFSRLAQYPSNTVAVEFFYKESYQCHARINSDGITYTVGEVYGEWYEYTETTTLADYPYSEPPYFGQWITDGYIEFPADSDPLPGVATTCSHAYDFSVLRIQGTIHLVKEQ